MAKKKTDGLIKAVMKVAIAGKKYNLIPGDYIDLTPEMFDAWKGRDMCELAKDDPTFAQAIKGHEVKAQAADAERNDALAQLKVANEQTSSIAGDIESLEWAVRRVCELGLVLEDAGEEFDELGAALVGLAEMLPDLDVDPELELELEDETTAEE